MTEIKKIFGMKDTPIQKFVNPERQSVEQTEDYATKKVVYAKEIVLNKINVTELDQAATTKYQFILSTGTPANKAIDMHTYLQKGIISLYDTNVEKIRFDADAVSFLGSMLSIGSSSVPSSVLFQVVSTTRGFLPPCMTTAQKNAIGTPATGLIVFDTDLNALCIYYSAGWHIITAV